MSEIVILGMAKSCLDLKGAKRQKIELDFLRLAYVCDALIREGGEAVGYFAVVTSEIASQVEKWQKQYKVTHVQVCVFELQATEDELANLRLEKGRNQLGNLGKAFKIGDLQAADGSIGRELVENFLALSIEKKHKAAALKRSETSVLRGINWDYLAVCTEAQTGV